MEVVAERTAIRNSQCQRKHASVHSINKQEQKAYERVQKGSRPNQEINYFFNFIKDLK